MRPFGWTLLNETVYGVNDAPPDFDDPIIEPALRRDLLERLVVNLVGRALSTRRVLPDLQQL